jgi:hypothetical protein
VIHECNLAPGARAVLDSWLMDRSSSKFFSSGAAGSFALPTLLLLRR